MASNESTYYQLPIWNTDDPVLREEFNELNNKLDMLLHALPFMEVCKKQVSEETYSVSMDVSMLDLTGFACLYLGYSVPGIGYPLRHKSQIRKITPLIHIVVCLLLFLLGLSIGLNRLIIDNLGYFCGQAAVISSLSILGSMMASLAVYRIFFRGKGANGEK